MLLSFVFLCTSINIQALLARSADVHDSNELNLQLWNSYKIQFNKMYKSAEEDRLRMKIYLDNAAKISEHNERFKKGEVTFELGVNHFSDLTLDEIDELYTSHAPVPVDDTNNIEIITPPSFTTPAPKTKNWTAEGAVTSVKSQEDCGCCWAFAAAGVLESHVFIKTGILNDLSAQNLLDCVRDINGFFNSCGGGFTSDALYYVKLNGIVPETVYPYQSKRGSCRLLPPNMKTNITGYKLLLNSDGESLKNIVGHIGPVTFSIDSTDFNFRHYRSGVYHSENCSQSRTNHAAVIVGYGTDENGLDYWLVKNSWNTYWGENGYAKVLRNRNVCAIESRNIYPYL